MTFTVESGIALPKRTRGPGRKATEFPFAQMDVESSFLIPCDPNDPKAVSNWRRKLLIAKKRFLAQYEGKFRTAIVEGGLRVWRTA